MGKPVAWSYTALTAFETCPRRFFHTRIAKDVVEPEGEALKWGNRVHQALEAYLLHGVDLPSGMQHLARFADRIKAKGQEPGAALAAERKIALDDAFRPVAFFSKSAWVRGVLDVSVKRGTKLFVGDWKTGKPKPDSDQLRLFAAIAMADDPEVQEVITAFLWLQDNTLTASRFTREDAAGIWQSFMPRVARLQHAVENNKFPPRPSGLCRSFCPVGRSRCEHCGT